MSEWSEDSVSLLKTLKAQGYPASHISRMLRATTGLKVSRSAVIGKCFRLGLNEADKSAARIAARLQSARVRRYGAEIAEKRRRDKKALSAATVPSPYKSTKTPLHIDRPNAVRFISREPSQCSMFLDGEEGAQGFVCGEPIAINRFCAECASLVYQPVEKRKAA